MIRDFPSRPAERPYCVKPKYYNKAKIMPGQTGILINLGYNFNRLYEENAAFLRVCSGFPQKWEKQFHLLAISYTLRHNAL
jgi:hypothetical protein